MYKIRELKKAYSGKADYVLKGLSFDIHKGEILGILGVNGAGKTTLIKLLLRALEPSCGEIEFLGKDLSRIPLGQYYRFVSAVLEKDRNVYWYLTGFQNIEYFGRLKKLKDDQIAAQAEKLLTALDLNEARDQIAGNYSRGMLQKLSIIIAMLGDPEVLFLDEPTLGLDIVTKRAMMGNLHQLAKEKNTTIVITSHQLDVIDEVTDRVLMIEGGQIAYIGKTYDFKQTYSENKYTVTVSGLIDQEDPLLKEYLCEFEQRDGTSKIILRDNSSEHVNQLLTQMLHRNYEIVAFSKDSHRLEDVMEAFIHRGEKDV